MSRVHIFRAASTQEAFALVREALGIDAIILRTQRRKVGYWPWTRQTLVEVEAVSDMPSDLEATGHETDLTMSDSELDRESKELERNRRRIAGLEQMISQLATAASHDSDSVPAELFQTFTELLDSGMEETDARSLLMSASASRVRSLSKMEVRTSIRESIQSALPCSGPIRCHKGTRRVIALVGPTGVGKTTTIAKLASQFHLQESVQTGLITTDTFRSAAVDQLKTYADALGLPLEVAGHADELHAALSRMHDRELVLVDTAGRSPKDEPRLNELRALLRGGPIDEIHLVLSLTTSPRVMADLADHFRPLAPTALILTKLDEALGPGTVYSATRRVACPLSYLTDGQAVPDDIETPNSKRLATMILPDEFFSATHHVERSFASQTLHT